MNQGERASQDDYVRVPTHEIESLLQVQGFVGSPSHPYSVIMIHACAAAAASTSVATVADSNRSSGPDNGAPWSGV